MPSRSSTSLKIPSALLTDYPTEKITLHETLESKERRLVTLRQEIELRKQKPVRAQNKAQSDRARIKKEKEIQDLETEIASMRKPPNDDHLVARASSVLSDLSDIDTENLKASTLPSRRDQEPNIDGLTQKPIDSSTSTNVLNAPGFPMQQHEDKLTGAQQANGVWNDTSVGIINDEHLPNIKPDAMPGQSQTEGAPETTNILQDGLSISTGGSKDAATGIETANEDLKSIPPKVAKPASVSYKHQADGHPDLLHGQQHEERPFLGNPLTDGQIPFLFSTGGDGTHTIGARDADKGPKQLGYTELGSHLIGQDHEVSRNEITRAEAQDVVEGPKQLGPEFMPNQDQETMRSAGSGTDVASHVGRILDQAMFGPTGTSVVKANTNFPRFSIAEPRSTEGLPISDSSTNKRAPRPLFSPATSVDSHSHHSATAQSELKVIFDNDPNTPPLTTFPLPAPDTLEPSGIIEDSVLTNTNEAIAEVDFSRTEMLVDPAVPQPTDEESIVLGIDDKKVVETGQGSIGSNDDHVSDKLKELLAIAKANGLTLVPFKTEDSDEVDMAAFAQAPAGVSNKKATGANGGKKTRKRKNAKIEGNSNQLEGFTPIESEGQQASEESKIPAKKRKINQDDDEYQPETDAEEGTEALKVSKSTVGDAGGSKGSRKKVIDYEEKVALAKDISKKREAEEAIQEFLIKGTKIDPTLKNLLREVDFFVSDCGSICKELSLKILTTKFGTTRCLNHHNTRNSVVNDWNGTSREFQNTGVPFRESWPRQQKRADALHCGCHWERAVLEFYMFKTGKIGSREREELREEGEPEVPKEGWKMQYLHPRLRELVLGQVQDEAGWCLDDIWTLKKEQNRWVKRSEIERLEGMVRRMQNRLEVAKNREFEAIQQRERVQAILRSQGLS
ncbi:hypothetical protein GYMLUDRAFT_243874 [Collybiopsis luxurians FD-317 M1]|uniref:BZIP domain-containing protein n=1 Tax=Collybiopsis luxurians FD-317 M1 TaxID=944289 RepID=A0A0D0BBX6_9AGAR|nr:hypothetical protein GYMLUDRAFT_243874 [Collybiopsis luxurians FD-317 M1]